MLKICLCKYLKFARKGSRFNSNNCLVLVEKSLNFIDDVLQRVIRTKNADTTSLSHLSILKVKCIPLQSK